MPYDELTKKTLESIANDIRNALANKRLDNSGTASNSLEIDGNKLLGIDYLYYLDQGRSPGKFPPVKNLQQWVRDKLGIEDSEAKQIAFLVGRKIANQGTDIYINKSLGIELENIIEKNIDELLKLLPEMAAAEALTWL